MNKIESSLFDAISKHPKTPLVIAYSGGVDSQVLLYALASLKAKALLKNTITVCHVNHGLSENAQQWQAFATQQCQQVNLPLVVFQVDIQAQAQQSLEALARDARYNSLQSTSLSSSIILTGHHSDDQAETFLLALKRGSGLKGLSAMVAETQQGKDLLVRPFLAISRAQIIEYANAHNLTWVEDESNVDTRFDRNFIRQKVMPLITKRWPSMVNTINRSSDHCREGQLLLDELAAEDLILCQQHTVTNSKNAKTSKILSVKALQQLSTARFNNLIRYFLAHNRCLMPSTEQLNQLKQQLNASSDKNPAVKVGENYFRRYKSALYLTENFKDISDWSVELKTLNRNQEIELPDNLGKLQFSVNQPKRNKDQQSEVEVRQSDSKHLLITLPSINSHVSIRFSHNNPTCLPDYRNHSRPLKKVLQELNIPPWQRKRIPFLYYDGVLVAAIGYFVCKKNKPFLPISIINGAYKNTDITTTK